VDNVWFLAGSDQVAPVVRHCQIPAGKSLFFPLINNLYGAFLNDPPDTTTEAYVRAAASCTQPAQIALRIDGVKVPKASLTFTGPSGSQSPIFNLQLPPGNYFGVDDTAVPELVFSPSAEQGYYVFVYPLTRGAHVISWKATGCTSSGSQDITYYINVGGNH
jgi:hypothetical protein